MQDGPQVSGHIRSLPWGLNAFEEVDSLHLYDFVLPDLGGGRTWCNPLGAQAAFAAMSVVHGSELL